MDINFCLIWDALPLLLAGAGITIEITALSVGFGLLIGMTVGISIVVLILRKFSVPVSNQLIRVKWKLAVL